MDVPSTSITFGKDDPVAVAVVHRRDDEPLGQRVQNRATIES
jgi:hypothetical protein